LTPDEPPGGDSDRSPGTPTDRTPSCRSRVVAAGRGRHQHRRLDLGGQPTRQESFAEMPTVCITDAGNKRVVILADRMPPP
jgi:hypothetical protein